MALQTACHTSFPAYHHPLAFSVPAVTGTSAEGRRDNSPPERTRILLDDKTTSPHRKKRNGVTSRCARAARTIAERAQRRMEKGHLLHKHMTPTAKHWCDAKSNWHIFYQ